MRIQPIAIPMIVFKPRPGLLGFEASVGGLGTGGLPADEVLVLLSNRAFTADEDHEEGKLVPLE